MKVERYCIYWANLDPTIGSEINKTRPVLVISNNAMNNNLKTVVVCPLTTSLHPTWRSRIQIKLGRKVSEIVVDQIRTISKLRLTDQIGKISKEDAMKVRIVIDEMYGSGSG